MSQNKKKTLSLEDLKNPSVAEKFIGDGLPDLGTIEVPVRTEEEKAKAEEQYQRRRAYAEGAGPKIATINRRIAEIKADPERLDLTPLLQEELSRLEATKAKLLVTDEGVRAHTEFSAFLAEIQQSSPAEVGEYLVRAVAEKRLRVTETPGNQMNIIYYRGTSYQPVQDATGKISPATLALVTELRKKIDADKAARRDAYREAIAVMKAEATEGFTLSSLVTQTPLHPVKIYGYLSPQEKKGENGATIRLGEAHILLEANTRAIKPIRAVGRLEKSFAELVAQGKFITLDDFRKGKLGQYIPDKETYKKLQGFLMRLLDAKNEEAASASRAAAAAKKTAPPAAETVPPAIEEKPATETAPPAPKKRAPTKKKTTETETEAAA